MKEIKEQLKYLHLANLSGRLDFYLQEAESKKLSHPKFLKQIIKDEYEHRVEKARKARITKAKIPVPYSIDTFPFEKEPHIDRARLLARYDSLDYITGPKSLIFVGAIGSGKTGLATGLLMNALANGYSGKFMIFADLMEELYRSQADESGKVIINKYSKIDCLLIDEVGRMPLEKKQIALFYNLIQQRHKKKCTIITTDLGLKEWDLFIEDKRMAAAIVDRLADGGHIIHLKNCKNLRPPPDID
ncbi:MAG: ATP-binding protein [Candidatus Nomurabacteria bacterium]